MSKAGVSRLAVFRPLDREEIEHRMDSVARALDGPSDTDITEGNLRPRSITAAELVRRVRPFIVLN
jgi:hypothetical protein